MLSKTLLAFVLLPSASSWAIEYKYQADVKGMVCAFCAYNVDKNISTLPGVDAGSVDVDLKGGHVTFHSNQIVNEVKLAAVITASGFTLSNLQKSELNKTTIKQKDTKAALVLEIDRTKIEQYNSALENIGTIAASTPSHLLIKAPVAYEDKLLKPILMGRQQVIKVRFVPEESEMIRIQLFAD